MIIVFEIFLIFFEHLIQRHWDVKRLQSVVGKSIAYSFCLLIMMPVMLMPTRV